MESGGSCTNYLYKVMTPEIVDEHQAEARAFLSTINLSKTAEEIIAMEEQQEEWVCTILMYASILNDEGLFRRIMEAWDMPHLCFMADFCDYYPLVEASAQPDGSHLCKFKMWRHGGGSIAECVIRHDSDDWACFHN